MRLSKDRLREILVAHEEGASFEDIAERFAMDEKSVVKHVERFIATYGSITYVHAVFRATKPRVCTHPSLKCLICGQAQDHIHRHELEEIAHLRRQLEEANERLRRYGAI